MASTSLHASCSSKSIAVSTLSSEKKNFFLSQVGLQHLKLSCIAYAFMWMSQKSIKDFFFIDIIPGLLDAI